MTQADRVLSTPPTNTPVVSSRRGFLGGTAAALAAGTAVNVAALATFRPANAASDPIYAAIEAHKAAAAVAVAAVKRNSDLENELYDNKRLQTERRLEDESSRQAEIDAAIEETHHFERVGRLMIFWT